MLQESFLYFCFYKLACYYIENFTFQTEHIPVCVAAITDNNYDKLVIKKPVDS